MSEKPVFIPGQAPAFDMRDHLSPRRMTLIMWDTSYLMRHLPGQSFADYDRVLDETIERGYNTIRIDPIPELIDLKKPETVFDFREPPPPLYNPWERNVPVEGPLGAWLVEFMEKLLKRGLNYTLSTWGFTSNKSIPTPHTHEEAAIHWLRLLEDWKHRFGFEGLAYVDIDNEVPYFHAPLMQRFKEEFGQDWIEPERFSAAQIAFLARELNDPLRILQRAYPELRFTASIHADQRWLDVPLRFDCLDAHFYVTADPRWNDRTLFDDYMPQFFHSNTWHKDFNERCHKAMHSVAPMLRARQRAILGDFAAWGERQGMPLTTSESWSSWYYYDSPDLDWDWLLEFAEWTVEDAIEFRMWGWTPHNYCQPQFENWKDVRWHRRLTDKFLSS